MQLRFDGYFVDEDEQGRGKVLALTRSWDPSYIPAIKKHDARIIRLSEYNGWPDSEVSFLSKMTFLEGVEIISDKVCDVRPIEKLFAVRTCR